MNPRMRNGQGGANTPAAETTHTNSDLDFATAVRQSKRIVKLVKQLAKAGYTLHCLKSGWFMVSKYGLSHFAFDQDELATFAERLGVSHG